jgi:RNA polymerase sigma-70 factor (ECF subfamily)
MELPDNQLIRRIKGGDSNSFATLVERYKKPIFNLMYRYSNSVEDAADMTQDVFCRVFEKLDLYREKRKFFSWLYTLALNYARDWKRKQDFQIRKVSGFGVDEQSDSNPPEQETESKQQVDKLLQALDTLPEDRKEMVILRYRHERSIKELAEIFNLSESAVKMRLQRTLADLGQKLNGAQHGKKTRNQ